MPNQDDHFLRIHLCIVIFVAALFVHLRTAPAFGDQPNVLFIAIDDLRPALGCYGDPRAKSPNIDQFAKSARQFNRAYVQQAVCGPSRTSLLTGLLPDHTRVWHNRNHFRNTLPDHITLPQLFKQNGYRTIGLGKIFSGNEKELDPQSWSRPETLNQKGWKKYLLPTNQGKQMKQAAFENPEVADEAYADGKLANLAVKTLESLNQDRQPFFLAVGFFKPHLPFNAPKKYWDRHYPAKFDLPESIRRSTQSLSQYSLHYHRELGGYKGVPKNEELDQEQTRHLRHGYYACVSYVDEQVGKVLRALKQLELDDNTIVIIWGDHGFALGEASRWCKGTNFEFDTRVPLLIRTPGQTFAGKETNALVEMVDLYPTLAELAKLESPANLDGRSFAEALKDPYTIGRKFALSQFNRPWKSTTPEIMGYSIRGQNERYTRWIDWKSRKTVAQELYDYTLTKEDQLRFTDSFEMKNVAESRPKLLKSMSEQMDGLLESRIKRTAK